MKSHLDLHSWRIDRASSTFAGEWFRLWIKGEKFPRASGPLPYVAKALKQAMA